MNNDSLREELFLLYLRSDISNNKNSDPITFEKFEKAIKSLISKECYRARPTPLSIGMLRQWLNEDRIKDAKRFVTNEMIEHWLELNTPKDNQ